MHINEVHEHVSRSMATTVKVAEAAIEYYEQRIKELKSVVVAANRAAADHVLPRSEADAETQSRIAQSVSTALGNGNLLSTAMRNADAGEDDNG